MCAGTFRGQDGVTYTCQHAIDNGWASGCAEVATWTDATCSTAAPPASPTAPSNSCAGTFRGQDGITYTCQHAIDQGWASGCDVVATWTDATCSAAAPTTSPTAPSNSCAGTFRGQDGTTYTCQHAIDQGWASGCAEVATWADATCSAVAP